MNNKLRFPKLASGLIFSWLLGLILFQFITLVKFTALVSPNAQFGTLAQFRVLLSGQGRAFGFNGLDSLLFWFVVLAPLVFIWVQVRSALFSDLIHWLEHKPLRLFGFVSLLFLVLCRSFLHPGDFAPMGDGPMYLGGVAEFVNNLNMGYFSDYSTRNYAGWGPRQYLGNMFTWSSGFVSWLLGFPFGVKFSIFIFQALSGIGAFYLGRRLTKSTLAGLAAGLVMVFSYWPLQQILMLGRLHLSLVYACLPWPFFFLESALQDSKKRWLYFSLMVIPLSLCTWNHVVWGGLLTGFLVLYALIRFVPLYKSEPKVLLQFALALLAFGLITAGTVSSSLVSKAESLSFIYSNSVEMHAVNESSRIQPSSIYNWFSGRFSLGNIPPRSWYNSYIGLIPLILSGFGIFLFKKFASPNFRFKILGFSALLFLNLIILFFYFEIKDLPLLKAIRVFPDHRYQTFLVLFLAAGTALGVSALQRLKLHSYIIGIVATLLFIDLFPLSIQFPYGQTDPWHVPSPLYNAYRKQAETYEQKGEIVPYYLFIEGKSSYDYDLRTPGIINSELHFPSDQGVHNYVAPRRSQFTEIFYKHLEQRLKSEYGTQKEAFPNAFESDWFYLNNFKDALFFSQMERGYNPDGFAAIKEIQAFKLSRFKHHTPILAASELAPFTFSDPWNLKDASELQQLIAAMGIDQPSKTAQKLFCAEPCAPTQLKTNDTISLQLKDYRVYPNRFLYKFSIDQEAYVHLNVAWYSFLDVRLNQQKVEYLPSATRNIIVKVPKGEHEIVVQGRMDPWIRNGYFFGFALLILLLLSGFLFPQDPKHLLKRFKNHGP
jgi:hypothetical protein